MARLLTGQPSQAAMDLVNLGTRRTRQGVAGLLGRDPNQFLTNQERAMQRLASKEADLTSVGGLISSLQDSVMALNPDQRAEARVNLAPTILRLNQLQQAEDKRVREESQKQNTISALTKLAEAKNNPIAKLMIESGDSNLIAAAARNLNGKATASAVKTYYDSDGNEVQIVFMSQPGENAQAYKFDGQNYTATTLDNLTSNKPKEKVPNVVTSVSKAEENSFQAIINENFPDSSLSSGFSLTNMFRFDKPDKDAVFLEIKQQIENNKSNNVSEPLVKVIGNVLKGIESNLNNATVSPNSNAPDSGDDPFAGITIKD